MAYDPKRIDELTGTTPAPTQLVPVTNNGGPTFKATLFEAVSKGFTGPTESVLGTNGTDIAIKAGSVGTPNSSGRPGGVTISSGDSYSGNNTAGAYVKMTVSRNGAEAGKINMTDQVYEVWDYNGYKRFNIGANGATEFREKTNRLVASIDYNGWCFRMGPNWRQQSVSITGGTTQNEWALDYLAPRKFINWTGSGGLTVNGVYLTTIDLPPNGVSGNNGDSTEIEIWNRSTIAQGRVITFNHLDTNSAKNRRIFCPNEAAMTCGPNEMVRLVVDWGCNNGSDSTGCWRLVKPYEVTTTTTSTTAAP